MIDLRQIIEAIADILKSYNDERPTHREFKPGIGPLPEDRLCMTITAQLNTSRIGGQDVKVHFALMGHPDLAIRNHRFRRSKLGT